MRMGMGMGKLPFSFPFPFGLRRLAFLDEALDALPVLGSAEPGVFHRAAESHIIAEIVGTVGVGQQVIHVDLANLVVTGCIATVVRLVAFGHLEDSSML